MKLLTFEELISEIQLLSIKTYTLEDVVSILKKGEPSYKMVDDSKTTLLHLAVQQKNYEITKYLIDSGVEVDTWDHQGKTPLMSVLTYEEPNNFIYKDFSYPKYKIVKILLESKANIHLRDENGTSVWQMLGSKDDMIAELFVNELKRECSDSHSIARRLMETNCPLFVAVLTKDVVLVRLMLDIGFPIVDSKTKESALHVAIRRLDVKIIEVILKDGADACAKDVSGHSSMSLFGLEFKNTEKHKKILELLLNHKAMNFNEMEELTIRLVLEKGDRETISMLFRYDLKFRAKDVIGRTVLHYLALNRDPSILQVIRGKNFDFNQVDCSGLTALHLSLGTPEFVKFLLENGAYVDSTGHGRSMTPLFLAFKSSYFYRLKSIKLLLRHGANPQTKHNESTIFKILPEYGIQKQNAEPIVAHLVMLEALGTPIDKSVAEQIQRNPILQRLNDVFSRQIERMKNCPVYDSVNLFTLLAASDKRFECYMRNRNLAENFIKMKKTRVFLNLDSPLYDILRTRLKDAIESTELKENLAKIIFDVTRFHYDTHHIIVDNIINNFDIEDLRKFG